MHFFLKISVYQIKLKSKITKLLLKYCKTGLICPWFELNICVLLMQVKFKTREQIL